MSDADLVGVTDLSSERGKLVAARHGTRWFDDFEDLLAEVDAVTIATPTIAHFAVAAECLCRGVHALVEKPIASTLSEANELIRLAESSSAVLQVGHIERYNPAFLELQSVLEGMRVVALSARRLSPLDTSSTDVDVVQDLMIHDIDLALTLLGDDIELIQASGRTVRTNSADYVVATISVAGGPIATLTASRVTEQKVRHLDITADDAYVEVDLLSKTICVFRRTFPEYVTSHQRPLRYRQENVVERIQIPTAEPLMLELQDFVRCVRDGSRPQVPAADGRRALEVAMAVRRCISPAKAVAAAASELPDSRIQVALSAAERAA